MEGGATDLAERLKIVLDEREKTALAAIQGPWITGTRSHLSPHVVYGASPLGGDRIVQVANLEAAWAREYNAAFMVANGPDVALRTVHAHRTILERHVPDTADPDDAFCCWCNRTYPPVTHGGTGRDNWPCPDVRALVSIYFPGGVPGDHP